MHLERDDQVLTAIAEATTSRSNILLLSKNRKQVVLLELTAPWEERSVKPLRRSSPSLVTTTGWLLSKACPSRRGGAGDL